jgi:hypothetical protein
LAETGGERRWNSGSGEGAARSGQQVKGELQEVLVEVLGCLVGTGIKRKIELADGGNGGHDGSVHTREGYPTWLL